MIIQIIQKEFGQEPVFDILDEKTKKCIADCSGRNHVQTRLSFYNGKSYKIAFEPVMMENEDGTDSAFYVISESSRPIGGVCKKFFQQKKIFFTPIGYDFYSIEFERNNYFLYEMGLGADAHYLCLYEADELVAVVHKHMEIRSHLDTYTVYVEYNQYRDIACIAALIIDGLEYSHNDEIANSRIREEFLSLNKELKEKFNPDFIRRVKAAEE